MKTQEEIFKKICGSIYCIIKDFLYSKSIGKSRTLDFFDVCTVEEFESVSYIISSNSDVIKLINQLNETTNSSWLFQRGVVVYNGFVDDEPIKMNVVGLKRQSL